MEIITEEKIKNALVEVGLSKGQLVYLQSDLRMPGKIVGVKNKDEFCKVYFNCIFDIIGTDGTLIVPTYTTQVARFDIDFILEKTPSLMGIFSEYVRCQSDSIRSIHPINSLCAIGKEKKYICSNNGTNDFGWDSPFHRMLLKEAKILTIGLESGYAVGIAHFLEAIYDLPYVYNKLLKWSPYINGKKDDRQYFSTVRYLDLDIIYDLTAWVKEMRKIDEIKSARLGRSMIHMSDFKKVFNVGIQMLQSNPYFFLKYKPKFKYGKIPFDGPTSEIDNIAGKNDAEHLENMNWNGFYLAGKAYAGGDDDEFFNR